MVDIKELMRTYVFINDPNVKEITTKFGILLVGLALATVAVAGLVTLAEDAPATDTHAAGTNDSSEGELAADQTRSCVQEENADEWRNDNKDILLSGNLISEEENAGYVCFAYTNSS